MIGFHPVDDTRAMWLGVFSPTAATRWLVAGRGGWGMAKGGRPAWSVCYAQREEEKREQMNSDMYIYIVLCVMWLFKINK